MTLSTMIPENRTQGPPPLTSYLLSSGSILKVYRPSSPTTMLPMHRKKRGIVQGRSLQSKHRLQETLSRIDLATYPGLVHLTITFAVEPEAILSARFLDTYGKALGRLYDHAPVLWGKEPGEENGRWHYHAMVLSKAFVQIQRIQGAWNRVAGIYAGNVDVEFHQEKGAVRYLGKYISKAATWKAVAGNALGTGAGTGTGATVNRTGTVPDPVDLGTSHISPWLEEEIHPTGRTWGIINRKNLRLRPWRYFPVTHEAANQARRLANRRILAQAREREQTWYVLKEAYRAGATSAAPEWLRIMCKGKDYAIQSKLDSIHFKAARSLKRHETKSFLKRGGFNRHGFSCFFEDAEAFHKKLYSYLETAPFHLDSGAQ